MYKNMNLRKTKNFASFNLLAVLVNTLLFIQIHPTSYVLLNKKTILCAVIQHRANMWTKEERIIPQQAA